MLNMNKEEIKQEQNKELIARILGGTPTTLHKAFFVLMVFSLKNMFFTHIHKSVIFQLSISEIHFCVKGFFYSSYTFAAEK